MKALPGFETVIYHSTVADQKATHFGFHLIHENVSLFERFFRKICGLK